MTVGRSFMTKIWRLSKCRVSLQLVGGRQAHAAQQWVQSGIVYQERTDKNGHTHRWKERKILRSVRTDEKNGDLQIVCHIPIDPKAKHVYSPRAVPAPQPNKHLMVRDDFPEVLGAEMSAINGKKYHIPRSGPEAVASWSTRLSKGNPSEIHQMDPLSSPNDLSPLHMGTTPLMWLSPADMKIFLRPQDEALEDTIWPCYAMWSTSWEIAVNSQTSDKHRLARLTWPC